MRDSIDRLAPADLGLRPGISRRLALGHASELTLGRSERGGARFALTLPAA